MRRVRHVTYIYRGQMRNIDTILIEKPDGKRALVRPRSKWYDNIRMGIRLEDMVKGKVVPVLFN
jgi:hypothetical protein